MSISVMYDRDPRLLTADQYKYWLSIAARHARRAGEAEDLLHDALLAALVARRCSLADQQDRAWFAGMIRNKAKMHARTAVRRKRRETASAVKSQPTLSFPADDPVLEIVRSLPPATRAVATLALHGMTRAEIAFVLGLSDVALRQRLTTLRKNWASMPDDLRDDAIDRARARRRTIAGEMEPALMRRALLALVREKPGIGTHDPDGHLIVIERPSPSRSVPSRQR